MSLSSADKNKHKSSSQELRGISSNINPELQIRLDAQKGSTKLSIIDMFIGDEGAELLAKFLRENTQYEILEIRGNNISASGFTTICDALKSAKRIKTIAAEWNQIGSDPSGLAALHDLVRVKNTITNIDLRNNHIGPQSAGAIAGIIKDSEGLQTLDLRWNDIGDEGARVILGVLKSANKRIQIDLNGNKIHEELISEIASFDPYHGQPSVIHGTDYSISRSPARRSDEGSRERIAQQERGSYGGRQVTDPGANKLKESQLVKDPLAKREDFTPIRSTQMSSRNAAMTTSQKPTPGPSNIYTPAPYSRTSVQATPLQNPLKKSGITINGYNPEYDIKEIQARYEAEAREIREKYESHVQAHLKMGKVINELESNLIEERMRAGQAEEKLMLTIQDLENERNYRLDLEAKYKHLVDDLHRNQRIIEELKHDNEAYKREIGQARAEIAALKDENIQIDTFYKQKLRDAEENYHGNMRNLSGENESLRNQMERMRIDFDNRMRELQRDHDMAIRKLDDQIRNLTHINSDISEDLRRQTEYIQKLKLDHEEEVRRVAAEARDDEYRKAQIAIRELDTRFQTLQTAHDDLGRRNAEMLKDLQDYERQIRELQIKYENETTRQRNEIEKLREQITQVNATLDKQKNELYAKESSLQRLGTEYENLERELQRQKTADMEALERARREAEFERRRHEEVERDLTMKITELERRFKDAQNEILKLRNQYDTLGEVLQSNIIKVISQTVVDHGRSTSKYAREEL